MCQSWVCSNTHAHFHTHAPTHHIPSDTSVPTNTQRGVPGVGHNYCVYGCLLIMSDRPHHSCSPVVSCSLPPTSCVFSVQTQNMHGECVGSQLGDQGLYPSIQGFRKSPRESVYPQYGKALLESDCFVQRKYSLYSNSSPTSIPVFDGKIKHTVITYKTLLEILRS